MIQSYRFFCGIIISLLTGFAVITYGQSAEQIKELSEYIGQVRLEWNVPGLAVAVVHDGKTLLLDGFGKRQKNTGEPVDSNTIFAICSTTKAMTAACMAMLVDEGKASWDDKVVDHMPGFLLNDPYITRDIRIRDLFTHNTGTGNADALWAVWVYDTDEILRRMRYLPQSYPLRSGYTYQNIMYAAAGELIEKISGMPWEDFIEQKLFGPLGMTRTFSNLERSLSYNNRSVPHHYVDSEIVPIPDRSADPIGPAGSVWSCVGDMQKWMKFLLDSARVKGDRLISENSYKELFHPQVIVPDQHFYPTRELTKPHWKTYGLGWFQHDFNGQQVDFHTGSLRGTVAIIGLIREEKLGVYVFGNLDHAEVRHAIMYKVFDIFGDKNSGIDWSSQIVSLYTKIQESGKERYQEQMEKRVEGTNLSFPLNQYEGVYTNDFLGEIKLELKSGSLQGMIGEEHVRLSHFHYDTFLVEWLDALWTDDSLISFNKGPFGELSFEMFGQTFKKKQ